MEEETRTFVGRDAWIIVPQSDLLLWFEGEQIRIDTIAQYNLNKTPVYLHPASPAWEQAAQMADEAD